MNRFRAYPRPLGEAPTLRQVSPLMVSEPARLPAVLDAVLDAGAKGLNGYPDRSPATQHPAIFSPAIFDPE